MTRIPKFLPAAAPLVLSLALCFALAAPALASVASEQQQGAQILAQVQHRQLAAKSLSSGQYERVGEYLMGQALGSTQLHQRMNALMDQMMGTGAADQMHIYLGERYLGVSTTPTSRYAPLYGLMGVMMSRYRGSPLAGMMSRYLSGQSQTSSGSGVGPGMMGYGYGNTPTASSSSGWPTGAIIATIVLAALLVGGALAVVLPRLRRRSQRATSATR
jgi:hypothetical protein